MNCKLCNTEMPEGNHYALEHVANECIFSNMVVYSKTWQAIFDALSAARAEGFETCREMAAVALDNAAARQRDAVDAHLKSGNGGPATSFEFIFSGFADAIRALRLPAADPISREMGEAG